MVLENRLEECLDRIVYLEQRIDGFKLPRSQPDPLSLNNIKAEILRNFDDKQLLLEESKLAIDNRYKQLERKINAMNEEQHRINVEIKHELDHIQGIPDPLMGSQEIDRRIKQIESKRRKEHQEIHDDLIEIVDQKFIVLQKERATKLDRVIRELNELNRRTETHDDDLTEMTKVIQELDRDRIQDGKTSEILSQKYQLLDERIENLSEAIVEMNTIVTRTSRVNIDHSDLNVIKEA